jgi:AraC-like DNA-binding protein
MVRFLWKTILIFVIIRKPFAMPLYMDFHKFDHITIEDVKHAHMADVAVQEKYGVKYHQFWVNQEAGTVFCLCEGPDKETCETVHRAAHGNIACALVEVEPGFYELIMGSNHKLDQDGLVLNFDGSVDKGYRHVMVTSIQSITTAKNSRDINALKIPHEPRKLVNAKVAEFKGRKMEWAADDSLVNVFQTSADAVKCALEIQRAITGQKPNGNNEDWSVLFRIGISAGQPVTERDEFFGEAIKLAYRLSNLARKNQILLSSLANDLYGRESEAVFPTASIQSIKADEEAFITSLFSFTEDKMSDESFNIEILSKHIGVSRPQLYRKIVTLTGKSPNDLVRDLRMNKAATLLKKKSLNISQVAMEVGYNNPSYFSKCFAEKFGCTPSVFLEASLV